MHWASYLFSKVPVVLVSATLGGGTRFAPFARRLGLEPAAELGPVLITDGPDGGADDEDDEYGPGLGYADLEVESPFDFREQAMLYVAKHLPEPQEPRVGGRSCAGGREPGRRPRVAARSCSAPRAPRSPASA